MPPLSLFETHLNVRDLGRSVAFYRDVVGLELAYVLQERHVAFSWIGGRGRTMLGLWSGDSSPNAMRLHVAFSVDVDAVLASPSAMRASGIEPLDFYGRATTEPSVIGWMPAASVFFNDPDGHLLESLGHAAARAPTTGRRRASQRVDGGMGANSCLRSCLGTWLLVQLWRDGPQQLQAIPGVRAFCRRALTLPGGISPGSQGGAASPAATRGFFFACFVLLRQDVC